MEMSELHDEYATDKNQHLKCVGSNNCLCFGCSRHVKRKELVSSKKKLNKGRQRLTKAFAMEKARHSLNLLDLDNLILRQILGYLSRKELVVLRTISREMKNLADSELMSRKDKLVINDFITGAKQAILVMRLHRNITELQVNGPLLATKDVINFMDTRNENTWEFNLLECYTLSDYSCNISLFLVAYYWRNITILSLNRIDINDNELSLLLQNLNELRTLTVKRLLLKGNFLRFIGNQLSTIEWETCCDIGVKPSFSMNGKGDQIRTFFFRYIGDTGSYDAGRKIISLISKEFSNLCQLDLDVKLDDASIGNFNELEIPEKTLTYCYFCEICSDYCLPLHFREHLFGAFYANVFMAPVTTTKLYPITEPLESRVITPESVGLKSVKDYGFATNAPKTRLQKAASRSYYNYRQIRRKW